MSVILTRIGLGGPFGSGNIHVSNGGQLPTDTAYQLQFAFPTVSDTQWKRSVEVRLGFSEEQEGLMGPARFLALIGCE